MGIVSDYMLLNIGIIVLLILLNGFFALSELAILTSRRPRLQVMAEAGDRGAKVALELAEDPAILLSTVQVGITTVGILAGAYGGATLADEVAVALQPIFVQYSRFISLVLVVGTITYFSIVVGELIPKHLALRNPERTAAAVARPMAVIARVFRPIVTLLVRSTDAILNLLGMNVPSGRELVTEEEIKLLVEQGVATGIVEEAEGDMVASIFRFGDRSLGSIMTPRTEISWLDVNAAASETRSIVHDSFHTQFPVCDGELDKVLGTVQAKDLLAGEWGHGSENFLDMLQPALFLPESMPALRALEHFKYHGAHMAVIVDEFGGIEGLVTLIDMLEAIVGDIPTHGEIEQPPIVEREDGSRLIEGMLAIDDLKEALHLEHLPNEGDYHTLGGFMVSSLGRLPQTGDLVRWQDWQFEVVDMDGNRVDKVLARQVEDGPGLPAA